MKTEANTLDQIFAQLKETPTELSEKSVIDFIDTLDTMPHGNPTKNNWTSFITPNNIIMISIPFIIATSILLFTGNNNIETTSISSAEQKIENTTNSPITNSEIASLPDTNLEHILKEQELDINNEKETNNPLSMELEQKAIPVDLNKLKIKQPTKVIEEKHKIPSKSEPSNKVIGNSGVNGILSVPMNIDEPKRLNSSELRKLKRQLYRNLSSDKLILTKSEYVSIELPGHEIRINSIILSEELLLKYSVLTQKVGSGQYRKIELDPRFIKVGDYTPEGFDGMGFGRFQENFIDDENILLDEKENESSIELLRDSEIEVEQKELSSFIQNMIKDRRKKGSKMNLFGINMKFEKSVLLHGELYAALLEDGLIETSRDFVFIDIPKNEININGIALSGNLYTKYFNIITSFKIKQGEQRGIGLSESLIEVGIYSINEFTGTTTLLQ